MYTKYYICWILTWQSNKCWSILYTYPTSKCRYIHNGTNSIYHMAVSAIWRVASLLVAFRGLVLSYTQSSKSYLTVCIRFGQQRGLAPTPPVYLIADATALLCSILLLRSVSRLLFKQCRSKTYGEPGKGNILLSILLSIISPSFLSGAPEEDIQQLQPLCDGWN